jgi:hypothetical protein
LCITATSSIRLAQAAITEQSVFSSAKTSAPRRFFSAHVSKEGKQLSHTTAFAKGLLGVGSFSGVRGVAAADNGNTYTSQINELKIFLNKKPNARILEDRLQFIDTIFKLGDSQAEVIRDRTTITFTILEVKTDSSRECFSLGIASYTPAEKPSRSEPFFLSIIVKVIIVRSLKGKNVIAVMGTQNSGKSTFINYRMRR